MFDGKEIILVLRPLEGDMVLVVAAIAINVIALSFLVYRLYRRWKLNSTKATK